MKSNAELKEHEKQKIKELNDYVLEVVEELKKEHDLSIEKKDNTPYIYIKLGQRVALMYYPSRKGLMLCIREDFLKYMTKKYVRVKHTFGARVVFKELNTDTKTLIKTMILGAVLFEKELRK